MWFLQIFHMVFHLKITLDISISFFCLNLKNLLFQNIFSAILIFYHSILHKVLLYPLLNYFTLSNVINLIRVYSSHNI